MELNKTLMYYIYEPYSSYKAPDRAYKDAYWSTYRKEWEHIQANPDLE